MKDILRIYWVCYFILTLTCFSFLKAEEGSPWQSFNPVRYKNPEVLFDGCVDITTGFYCEKAIDYSIEGTLESFSVERYYEQSPLSASEGNLFGDFWSSNLSFLGGENQNGSRILPSGLGGALIFNKKGAWGSPKESISTIEGRSFNPREVFVYESPEMTLGNTLALHEIHPKFGARTYQKITDKIFRLWTIHTQTGNQFTFLYQDNDPYKLNTVLLHVDQFPVGRHLISWMQFHYGENQLTIKASDGAEIDYFFKEFKTKNRIFKLLTRVAEGNGGHGVSFEYEESDAPKIYRKIYDDGSFREIHYSPNSYQVSSIFKSNPSGTGKVLVASFSYSKGLTIVSYADGSRVIYHLGTDKKILSVEYEDNKEGFLGSKEFTYHSRGYITSQTHYLKDQTEGKKDLWEYDDSGRLVQHTLIGNLTGQGSHREKYTTKYSYGEKEVKEGDQTKKSFFVLEDDGYISIKKVYEEVPQTSIKVISFVSYLWDLNGNCISERVHNPESEEIEYETKKTYSASNSLLLLVEGISRTDQKVTHFEYGKQGLLDKKSLPDNREMFYEYKRQEQITKMYSSGGSIDLSQKFDAEGKLFYSLDAVKQTSISREYELGRLVKDTLSNGITLSYQYDGLGRVTKASIQNLGDIVYTYEGSQLKSTTRVSPSGALKYTSLVTEYDGQNRPVKEELPFDLGELKLQWGKCMGFVIH